MLDGNGAEANAANDHGLSQRHRAPVQNRSATQQSPRRRRRIDGAGCAIDEARRVVGVRMREDDRAWRDSVQTMQPVCTAIDHNAEVILLDK